MTVSDVQWGDIGSLPPDTAVAFVSGSRVEGFGNPASDHDLYVIRDTRDEVRRLTVSVAADGMYIDAESYRLAQWLSFADWFSAIDPRSPEQVIVPTPTQLDLYYRSAIGQPVGGASPALIAQRFDKAHCCAVAAASWAQQCARLRHRAESTGRWQDWRAALEAGVDSALAIAGEAFPSLKWRFEKAARTFGATSRFHRQAWALKSIGSLASNEYATQVVGFLDEIGLGDVQPAGLERVWWMLSPDIAVVPRRTTALVVVGASTVHELSGQESRIVTALDSHGGAILGEALLADAPAESEVLVRMWDARFIRAAVAPIANTLTETE